MEAPAVTWTSVVEPREHASTALEFLAKSDREFDAGDDMQASEKLWGAAAHALMAFLARRGEEVPVTHAELRRAAHRLSVELGNRDFRRDFEHANDLHKHFYHRTWDDEELGERRARARAFVERLLPQTPPAAPPAEDAPPLEVQ